MRGALIIYTLLIFIGVNLLTNISYSSITYDSGNNRIIVVGDSVCGNSSSNPCTFEDIYQADKAGTLTLVDRDGITGTDSEPVNNTYNLRPADEKVLGGAKHDLWVEIENWDGFSNATIRLIGKDEAGNDQTEDIVVTGNGIYYSSKLWTELTQTQVVSVTGSGSFDYELVQGQWGIVSKQGENQYKFSCKLQIGDGITETWLVDAGKTVIHDINDNFIILQSYGHLRLGTVVDETKRTTKDGCFIYTTAYDKYLIDYYENATFELYSTTLYAKERAVLYTRASPVINRIWNCVFIHVRIWGMPATVDFYRTTWQSAVAGPRFTHAGAFASDILVTDCGQGVQLIALTDDMTIRNYRIVNEDVSFNCIRHNANVYAINVDCKWIVEWKLTNYGKIYRQYTFNLRVVDAEGNPIPDARVKIWDNAGNLVVNETTDSNGRIPEQILTYGYYDQDHGSTPVMITPHTIRIHHQDYPPKEFQFVADEPIDWTISLKDRPKSSGIIQVYGTEYYPGEEGIIYAQLLYGDGTPANNAVCNVTIWNKDNMLVSNQQMKHITNSNGMYYYNFTVPDDISVFLADVVCENPTAYGSAEFHVSNIDEIAKRVWNYTERTLTDYNESSIAYAVWNYTNRTLTEYNESSIAQAVWDYTNRTLTNWNFTQGYIADYDVAELVYPGKEWKATLTISTIDGTPIDVDYVVVKIYDPSQTLVLTKNMTYISTGAYKVEWSVPASPALGLYQTFAEIYKDGVLVTKKYKVFRVAQIGPADIRVTALQKYVKKGESLPLKIEIKNAGGIGADFQITYWIEKDSGKYEETTETLYVAGGETKTIYRDILVPMIISKGPSWIKAKAFYDPSQPEAYSQDTFYISEGISEERGGGFTFAPTEPTKYPLIIIVSAPRPVDIYIYGCNNTLIKKIPHATGIVTEFLDEGKYIIKYVYDGKAASVSINLDRPRYITLSFQKTQEAVDIYPFIFGVVAVIASGIVFYLIIKRFRRSYISTDLSLRGFELHYEK